MHHRTRGIAALVALSLMASAGADRLFLVPTGKKYLKNSLLVETQWISGDDDKVRAFAGFAIGETFDMEVMYERISPEPRELTFNFGYNFIPPITDIAPGISFGVLDGMNTTSIGRRFYTAITFRVGNFGDYNWDIPAEMTLGGTVGEANGLNFGLMLPFADSFRFLTEYDTGTLRAGLEVRPLDGLRLRWVFEQDRTYLGVGYALRF